MKLINTPEPLTESDLKLMGCDFTNWPEECFDPSLFVDDNAKYQECMQIAGCSSGVGARRPFADSLVFRRKG